MNPPSPFRCIGGIMDGKPPPPSTHDDSTAFSVSTIDGKKHNYLRNGLSWVLESVEPRHQPLLSRHKTQPVTPHAHAKSTTSLR